MFENFPTHIIVGLDGSRLAESALPAARALARALGARVTLVHVLEAEPPETIHGEPHLTTTAQAQAYLEEAAQRLAREGVDVATHVHEDPQRHVVAGIAAHADELNADLIVLCAHGSGGLQSWFAGRTVQRVIAHSNRPVLVVPASAAGDLGTYRRFLLPVDQYGEAQQALPFAKRLAVALRAEVVLLTVVPTGDNMPGDAGVAGVFLPRTAATLLKFAEEEARATLERISGELATEGLTVVADVRRGDPAREILQAISGFAVDLVVMATHARLGLDGLWAGSVGPRILGAAPCPVLVVPIRS